MKLFNCIVDDGKGIYRTLTAAKSRKELLQVYGGNGTFEKIQDVTAEYFSDSTVEKLNYDLMSRGWGDGERKLICALVQQHIDEMKR